MDVCIMYGAIIAVVVSFAKRVPFVRNHPKMIAAVISAASAAYTSAHAGAHVDVAALAACIATQFGASVATYEVAIRPVRKRVETLL